MEIQGCDSYEMDLVEAQSADQPTQEEINEALSICAEKENLSTKERVEFEAKELGEKIEKLHKFLTGYNSDGIRYIVAAELPDAAIFLMREQEEAMTKYYNCLVSRLSIWGVKAPKEEVEESTEG